MMIYCKCQLDWAKGFQEHPYCLLRTVSENKGHD